MAGRMDGVAGVPALLFALALGACGPMGRPREGRLEATWTGSDKGRLSGTATAVWCRDARVALLTGVSGDTGVSLLIHPAESLTPGRYPILEPGKARTTVPAAALGLRLLGRMAVVGYQSASGALTLERAAGTRVSGRFESTAKVVSELEGTVQLVGRFRDVPVTAGGAACPP